MTKLKKLTEQEMKQSVKRFNKLLEYSFVNTEDELLLDEDDDTLETDDTNAVAPEGDLNGNNGEEGQLPATDNADGVTPDDGNGDLPPVDDSQLSMDDNSNMSDVSTEEPLGDDTENGDVEIDVSDIVDKQQSMEDKLLGSDQTIQKILDNLESLSDKIENTVSKNNTDIEDLKKELIKRTPTPKQIMQKRVVVSDPFNVHPKDYWDEKTKNSNYELEDDQNEKGEYELKQSDVDNINPTEVYRSFSLNDDDLNRDILNLF